MSDIPILTPSTSPVINNNTTNDISETLTVFNKNISFFGEKLNEVSSTLKSNVDKLVKPTSSNDMPKSLPKRTDDTSSSIPSKKPSELSKNLKGFGESLKGLSTSLSSSILGDTSFITQPFKQIGDLTKKTVSVFKRDKEKVRPKRDVLLKKGVEGSSAVFIVDWMKKIMGKGDDGGGFSLLEKLGLAGIASRLFPALAKALPFAMIAGGILWGVLDAIWAVGKAKDWGVSEASAGIAGFLAGRGEGWDNALKNAPKGALIGAGAGMLAFGPVGAIAGALLGGAVFGILGYLGPEKVAKFVDEKILKDKLVLSGIGGGIAGGIIGLKAGPLGMVIGALLGASLGVIGAGILEEKERTGDSLKDVIYNMFIQPIIDMFRNIGDWFRSIAILAKRDRSEIGAGKVNLMEVISDLTTAFTGIPISEASGKRVEDVETRQAITTEIKSRQQELEKVQQLSQIQDDINAMARGTIEKDELYKKQLVSARDKLSGDLGIEIPSSENISKREQDIIEKQEQARRLLKSSEQLSRTDIFDNRPSSFIEAERGISTQGYTLSDFSQTEKDKIKITLQDLGITAKESFNLSNEELGKMMREEKLRHLVAMRQYGDLGKEYENRFNGDNVPSSIMSDEQKQRLQNIGIHVDDALITSDGEVIKFNPNDSVIATKNDAIVSSDIRDIQKNTRQNNFDELNRIMESIVERINTQQSTNPVVQTNTIKRYDPSNIIESLAVAIP